MSKQRLRNQKLYEVFVRTHHSVGHQHVGSVKAITIREALLFARDLYTRRQEGVSIWVVLSAHIFASDPKAELFSNGENKPYRYPAYYKVPKNVKNL